MAVQPVMLSVLHRLRLVPIEPVMRAAVVLFRLGKPPGTMDP